MRLLGPHMRIQQDQRLVHHRRIQQVRQTVHHLRIPQIQQLKAHRMMGSHRMSWPVHQWPNCQNSCRQWEQQMVQLFPGSRMVHCSCCCPQLRVQGSLLLGQMSFGLQWEPLQRVCHSWEQQQEPPVHYRNLIELQQQPHHKSQRALWQGIQLRLE